MEKLRFPKTRKHRADLMNLRTVHLQNFSCWGKLGVFNRESIEREYSLVNW